ncbi:MAG TPA: bifunctional phosphoribosylaminoimidazolecarboxamide formyltransferase/IMP cyclohydrolase, partial [Planctomycetota bacterium]|nr:bifunctional phosphoribosylaminoimidazolecarboxamide formyltransferase/IMP cyclohydrolase [Planctomycetota bacterium]
FDKTDVVELAKALHERGVQLLSTGGTYKTLKDASIPVTEVAEYTGFPEMMDGRVKTLHPMIHGGLLANRKVEEHLKSAETYGIELIDLVVVNLYPFEATADKAGATTADKIEKIDIGGPSMLRSAAKNHDSVTVIVEPTDYARCIAEMDAHGGDTTLAFRQQCARTVFRTTARYDALIADELTRIAGFPTAEIFPAENALPLKKVMDLRYGENPHQLAALYDIRTPGAIGVTKLQQLNGKELSYNNLMDADAAWCLVNEFTTPACAIIKHTNPCGCATAADLPAAFARAYDGDPQAAFGGIIALNRTVDAATAEAMVPRQFVEVVIAPEFTPEALTILTTKPKWKANVRLLAVGAWKAVPTGARYAKNVLGGVLLQDYDTLGWEPSKLTVATKRAPSAAEMKDLEFAWLVCKHLKSNAICIVKDGELVGAGAGQMSRVNSTWIATSLAKERAQGGVAASDAFFFFPDGLETLAKAGITAVVQLGGSKGDPAVIEAADKAGVAMVLTGVRHFRH